jgi:hypothetical protein
MSSYPPTVVRRAHARIVGPAIRRNLS